MTEWLIASSLGFAAGFAACWFYKSQVQAAVVATNAAVVETKAAASTIASDIKKL